MQSALFVHLPLKFQPPNRPFKLTKSFCSFSLPNHLILWHSYVASYLKHRFDVLYKGAHCNLIIYNSNVWANATKIAWWRHQMEIYSTLLAICAGNSPVTDEFPAQRPVTRSFDVFFHLRLNREAGDLRRHRAHYDVIVMKSVVSVCYLVGDDEINAVIRGLVSKPSSNKSNVSYVKTKKSPVVLRNIIA